MKNNFGMYNMVVHTVNLLLLGCIGFVAFFSVVNISPVSNLTVGFLVSIFALLLIWGINYWYQYKKKGKWILPIAGTILYIVFALLLFGVILPFLAGNLGAN
jgi:uncharacterized membrane protein YidH (DUF202 family)